MGTCQSTTTPTNAKRSRMESPENTIAGSSHLQTPQEEAAAEVLQETSHPLMKSIETMQQKTDKPFGRVLDAGTGLNSLGWIAHLLSKPDEFGVSDWTAVTASEVMFREVTKEAKRLGLEPEGHLIVGNWMEHDSGEDAYVKEGDTPLLEGEMYDTILADYLIGAMDAFSPFRQDCVFERLAKHLKPGGRIYLIGTEPIPNKVEQNRQGENTSLVCQVKNARDACILLAGERCYREYPLSWTIRNMKRCGLTIAETSKFPLLHRVEDLHDQLGVARSMLKKVQDRMLAGSLAESIDTLEAEARRTTKNNPIHLGFDYLVAVQAPEE